jgi:hypothetical protein
MNRREMLAAGFRQLARALPGLTRKRSLGAFLTGVSPSPPPREALSFPKKAAEPALDGHNSFKVD